MEMVTTTIDKDFRDMSDAELMTIILEAARGEGDPIQAVGGEGR